MWYSLSTVKQNSTEEWAFVYLTPQSPAVTAPLRGEPSTLSVLAALGHLSQRERQGRRRRTPRPDFGIVRTTNRRKRLPNHRHSEEGEARRGNPFPLRRAKSMHTPTGMRIATTSVSTGLAMTGRFKTYAPIFLAMQKSPPRRALPLLGEVPSAHTGGRGLRGRMRCRRKRQNAVRNILFPIGSPIAMATPQSRYRSTAPLRGALRAGTVNPSPRRALPLLGEVPSAHTGERGLRSRSRCRREKTERTPTILFPIGNSTAMATPQSRSRSTAPLRGAPRAWTENPAPQGAAPLRGSPQCAHWGKGSPG